MYKEWVSGPHFPIRLTPCLTRNLHVEVGDTRSRTKDQSTNHRSNSSTLSIGITSNHLSHKHSRGLVDIKYELYKRTWSEVGVSPQLRILRNTDATEAKTDHYISLVRTWPRVWLKMTKIRIPLFQSIL